MTLIFGTVANGRSPHVVVSADGLSLAVRDNREFVCSGTTTKVWMFQHARAAVAHFGQNKFWDTGASSWHGIDEYMSQAMEDQSFMRTGDLIAALVEMLTTPIETTISHPKSASRFALWVARIDDSRFALIEELCWERSSKGVVLRRKSFGEPGKGVVAAAGDGHDIVRCLYTERIDGRYYSERLGEEDIDYAVEYHRRFLLAGLLEQSRQGRTVFGGKFQTVAISETECRFATIEL